ncbi:2-oxoacid:acceptor oxidoreductase family protein [Methanogenium sp. MK-MG]|uniref:2-oxoacid:acceptor oxidoreductase family protein n=1 Tax=Methanogenium sp. MK-MG TaxID=2599926 RepID=UPI0013ECBD6B|nr:2-oxoacid:acceptor oxidoreductase family protein [Methanogenium sp. MK-MG]KAF1078197.1 Pyruvate synthase subunit PorC [Methanogenium sp. MK-MG]
MFEIRLHSRGGQGGVTAAKLIAYAAFLDGKYATATPLYGAERRGAPVVSFIRIDDEPIRIYSQIRNPDLVIVLDESIMQLVDVLHGIKPDGEVLINSQKGTEVEGHRTYPVDLTGISLALDLVLAGNPILNTPLIGAISKLGVISQASAKQVIAETFRDERNVEAALRAYEELKI